MMTKGRCKHASCRGLKHVCALGLDPEAMAKAACAKGEDYRQGLFYRLPCDSKEWHMSFHHGLSINQLKCLNQKAVCEKFCEPTDAEIAAHEAEFEAYMKKFELSLPLIKRIKKEHNESWAGIETCPACGGKLHLKLNCFFSEYQGENQKHLHGKCETDGCLFWME